MNPIIGFFKRHLEHLTERFYEGPEPPQRLRDDVLLFRTLNPMSSVDDVIAFASRAVDAAYRQGFERGYEWRERGLMDPGNEAERVLDEAINNWDMAEADPALRAAIDTGTDPTDPLCGVPAEERAKFFDAIGLYNGTHRVVLVDDDGNPIGHANDE